MDFSFPISYKIVNYKTLTHKLFSLKYGTVDCEIENSKLDTLIE